jgi:hypothetical protein
MKIVFFSIVVLWLASCKTIEVDPPAPEFKGLEEMSPTQPSVLFIQTEIALKPYLTEANQRLDKKFAGKSEQCEGVSYAYHFEREPLLFKLKDKEVETIINGAFDLRLNYCPSCHDIFGEERCAIPRLYASCGVDEPKRKVHLSYQSKIGVSEDFVLRTKTQLKDFELIDPCKITVFQYDASSTIEKEVKASLIQLEKEIDQQLAQSPVKSSITEVWKSLQKPILVKSYGYFYFRPQTIGIADLMLKDESQKATFTTQLTAQPVFSTNELDFDIINLPKNTPQNTKENRSTLHLRTIASYDSINQFLSRDFDTQKISITPKKEIHINKVQILGPQAERLVLAIEFSGSKKGVFYLVAEPYIDIDQHLRIRKVDFELKTKSILLHSAKWILDAKVKEQIEANVAIDLGPILTESQIAIEKQINGEISKGVWLNGSISDLQIEQLLFSSNYFVIDFQLSGLLKLKIQ